MSNSIKKYAEMYENKLEEKMISKGFGEKDSHDEEHVRKVVCKHFDLELTDDYQADCDHYIYEESTADGYTVFVSMHDNHRSNPCVSENIFYYDNDLGEELKQAIYDADHGDAKIYLSMLYDEHWWVQDAINEIYIELVKLYTEMCKDELSDEGFDEPATCLDILNLVANNE